MARKLLSSLLLSVALLTVISALPGIPNAAFACDGEGNDCYRVPRTTAACNADVDCHQTPDPGPILACDSNTGDGCG